MTITDEMLAAAVKKAVETGLIPKYGFADSVEMHWQAMKQCLQAAIDIAEAGQ